MACPNAAPLKCDRARRPLERLETNGRRFAGRVASDPRRTTAGGRLRAAATGTPTTMEGGIAILLLVIVLAVVAVLAFGLLGTGGVLSSRRRGPGGTESYRPRRDEERPRHTRPTTPAQEGTDFAGTDDEPASPARRDR